MKLLLAAFVGTCLASEQQAYGPCGGPAEKNPCTEFKTEDDCAGKISEIGPSVGGKCSWIDQNCLTTELCKSSGKVPIPEATHYLITCNGNVNKCPIKGSTGSYQSMALSECTQNFFTGVKKVMKDMSGENYIVIRSNGNLQRCSASDVSKCTDMGVTGVANVDQDRNTGKIVYLKEDPGKVGTCNADGSNCVDGTQFPTKCWQVVVDSKSNIFVASATHDFKIYRCDSSGQNCASAVPDPRPSAHGGYGICGMQVDDQDRVMYSKDTSSPVPTRCNVGGTGSTFSLTGCTAVGTPMGQWGGGFGYFKDNTWMMGEFTGGGLVKRCEAEPGGSCSPIISSGCSRSGFMTADVPFGGEY